MRPSRRGGRPVRRRARCPTSIHAPCRSETRSAAAQREGRRAGERRRRRRGARDTAAAARAAAHAAAAGAPEWRRERRYRAARSERRHRAARSEPLAARRGRGRAEPAERADRRAVHARGGARGPHRAGHRLARSTVRHEPQLLPHARRHPAARAAERPVVAAHRPRRLLGEQLRVGVLGRVGHRQRKTAAAAAAAAAAAVAPRTRRPAAHRPQPRVHLAISAVERNEARAVDALGGSARPLLLVALPQLEVVGEHRPRLLVHLPVARAPSIALDPRPLRPGRAFPLRPGLGRLDLRHRRLRPGGCGRRCGHGRPPPLPRSLAHRKLRRQLRLARRRRLRRCGALGGLQDLLLRRRMSGDDVVDRRVHVVAAGD